MKSLYWPLALILLAGVAAALWLAEGKQPETATAESGASPLDADYDYYIQDMLTTRFNSAGQMLSQLQAERVTHYPDGDRAELQAPSYTAFGAAADAWQVSAEAGTLAPDAARAEDRLELQGQVVLNKPLASGDFVEVRTSALTVFTDAEEALTTAPVAVRTRDTRLDGAGMQALLAQDYIKLNDGRGTHDPTPLP